MLKRLTVLAALAASAACGQINGQWSQNRLPGTSTVWTAWRTSNEVWAARAVAVGATATAGAAYAAATGAAAVASSAYAAGTNAQAVAGTALSTATGAAAVASSAYAAGTNGAALGLYGYAAATNAQALAAAGTNTAASAYAKALDALALAASGTGTAWTAYAVATNAQASAASATGTAWTAYAVATNANAFAAAATNTAAAAEGTADNAEFLASIALTLAESYYGPSTNAQAVAAAAAAQAQTASSNALAVYATATNAQATASNALFTASYPAWLWGNLGGYAPGAQALTAWQSLAFTAGGVPRVTSVTWATNTWWTTWRTAYPTNALGDALAMLGYNNGVATTVPDTAGFPQGPYLPYPSDGADQWDWDVAVPTTVLTNAYRLTALTNAAGVSVYFGITNRYAGYLYGTNMTAYAFTNATEFWLAPLQEGVTQAMRFAWNRAAQSTGTWDVASQTDMTAVQGELSDHDYWIEFDFPEYLASKVSTNDAAYLASLSAAATALQPDATNGLLRVAWTNPAYASDFTWSSDGTAITITGYTGAGGAVVIPEMLDGLPVTAIGANAFSPGGSGITSITSISGGSVLSVGDYAFFSCTSLSSASLPAATSIGANAFYACTSLSSVSLPAATSIGFAAFAFCANLSSVSIPAATGIGAVAFTDCLPLVSVTFSENAPAEAADVFVNIPANQVTNYVTNPTATGWGATWNGMPVVRLPLYGDGSALTGLTAAQAGAVGTNDAGYAGAVAHTNRTDNPHGTTAELTGAVGTNVLALVKDPSGFGGDTDEAGEFVFDASTRVLTLTNASAPIAVYAAGTRVVDAQSVTWPAIGTNRGAWYCSIDRNTGTGRVSQTAWGLDDIQAATVYWQTETTNAWIYEETHGFMPWTVHRRFHLDPKLSSAYVSGLTVTTNGAQGFVCSSGAWMDEDIYHAVSPQTQCLVGYRNGSDFQLRGPRSACVVTNAANGNCQYDLNGTLTDVATSSANDHFSMWAYITPCTTAEVFWVVGRAKGSLATIRQEAPPDISQMAPTAEAILLYQFIRIGSAGTFVEAVDYRTASVKGSQAAIQFHATLAGRDAVDSHPAVAITGFGESVTNIAQAVSRTPEGWLLYSNTVGAVTLTNLYEAPIRLYGTGAVSVAFSGLRSPQPLYLVARGMDTLSFPSNTYFVGGATWQTNRSNHFIAWEYGANLYVNPVTTSED